MANKTVATGIYYKVVQTTDNTFYVVDKNRRLNVRNHLAYDSFDDANGSMMKRDEIADIVRNAMSFDEIVAVF